MATTALAQTANPATSVRLSEDRHKTMSAIRAVIANHFEIFVAMKSSIPLLLRSVPCPIQVVLRLSSHDPILKRVALLEMPRIRGDRQVRYSQEMFGGDFNHLGGVEVQLPDLCQDPVHRQAGVLSFAASEGYGAHCAGQAHQVPPGSTDRALQSETVLPDHGIPLCRV